MSFDQKTLTVDTTVDLVNGVTFGADSQADTTPTPKSNAALADALAARSETLTNKNIASIARPGGAMAVPDGPGTLATVAQLSGASPVFPDFTRSETGSVTRTWNAKAGDTLSVKDFGAVGDGTTDDAAAFGLADGYETIFIPRGTYKFNSNTTIDSTCYFTEGAILKPASGVTITLAGGLWAFPRQCFDLSLGGLVKFGASTRRVYAEWWGALGNDTKTDNDVEINQAIAALENATLTVIGGTVMLAGGIYLCSSKIQLNNRVSIAGTHARDTILRVNNATWDSTQTRFIVCRNQVESLAITGISKASPCVVTVASTTGLSDTQVMRIENAGGMTQVNNIDFSIDVLTGTTIRLNSYGTTTPIDSSAYTTYTSGGTITRHISQFEVKLQSLTIDMDDNPYVTWGIYAPSWNEHCGIFDCLVYNYIGSGLRIDGTYGGTATVGIHRTEFFASTTVPTSAGLDIYSPAISNWTNVSLHECVFVGPTSPSGTNTSNGVSVNGLVLINQMSVHFEHVGAGYFIAGVGNITGSGLTGGPSVDSVIELFSNFTGRLDLGGVKKGAATTVLTDGTALAYTGFASDPDIRLEYPPRFAVIRRTYTSSSTWTKADHPGVRSLKIIAVGGGGAGGGATGAGSQCGAGGGGGAGTICEKTVNDLTAIATLTVTVGAAGVGVSGSAGGAGTASTVTGTGVSMSATGGAAGQVVAAGTSVVLINSSGTGVSSGGDYAAGTPPGPPGLRSSGTLGISGTGGSHQYGRGGAGRQSAGNGSTTTGAWGAGGAGALSYDATSYAGSDGAPGIVFIDEYY